ncbi:MAG: ATP-binding protein, partial [Anaerolineae bacterium]|nr:ATP-binding protein [Anaerolineae bacterium]
EDPLYSGVGKLLGVVIEKSNVNTIRVEVMDDKAQISEGSLVSVMIGDRETLYQIVDGIAESEDLERSNRHGYVQVVARKIGRWVEGTSQLEQVPWTPQIYAPVYSVDSVESTPNRQCIGYIPRTNYGIKVDCNQLVTHNTAILGVLGMGKTFLALELVERMAEAGIKVWVIDTTNEYEKNLTRYISSEKQAAADKEIQEGIEDLKTKYNANKELGGNHPKFRELIQSHIGTYLLDETWTVRVFNPDSYYVTEQTGWRDKQGEVGFGEYSRAQKTRVIAEVLLDLLSKEQTSSAKLCLVLEEAHSLAPEWNVVVDDGDKAASNATAKAILQGRKYGFGCLVITQRTAHVTKSILNQCHTIFALRTFDRTGMEFLSNYLGDDYTNMLNSLEAQQCVAYGRAINSGTPLIVSLNRREDFISSALDVEVPDEEQQEG